MICIPTLLCCVVSDQCACYCWCQQVYSSLTGIKILNIVTNRVVSTVGSAESGERFLAVALYQVESCSHYFVCDVCGDFLNAAGNP
jgi:hypothetical protein